MKSSAFYLFLSIVLFIHIITNYYIFRKIHQALPNNSFSKYIFYILFITAASSYFIYNILEYYYPNIPNGFFAWLGSIWFAVMLYAFLLILFIDILRLINHFIPFFPAIIYKNYQQTKLYLLMISSIIILILLVYGYFNAANPRLITLNFDINKKSNLKKLKIVAASDLHLGKILNYNDALKFVEKVNNLNPDIILLPGDIVDRAFDNYENYNVTEPLKNLKSKYGVFAITGNHEYIGNVEKAVKHLTSLRIKFLRDSSILIDNSFYLIGREDRSFNRFYSKSRKTLDEITQNIDKTKPMILLDHQPFELNHSAELGIDLHLTGHTHHGQMFPINLITNLVYEKSWGYLKKSNTNYYISSGYGTWGPPIRIGNHPELLLINLKFNN